MVYTELEVWKESRKLVKQVYLCTQSFPTNEQYGLTNQIRRCSVSVPSNIAEGCGRSSSKDTLRFLHIFRGSLYELETQLYIALDLNYFGKDIFDSLLNKIMICKKLLNGFINYYNSKING